MLLGAWNALGLVADEGARTDKRKEVGNYKSADGERQ